MSAWVQVMTRNQISDMPLPEIVITKCVCCHMASLSHNKATKRYHDALSVCSECVVDFCVNIFNNRMVRCMNQWQPSSIMLYGISRSEWAKLRKGIKMELKSTTEWCDAWTNDNQVLLCYMASQGLNELNWERVSRCPQHCHWTYFSALNLTSF